jgi:hypothetical protein
MTVRVCPSAYFSPKTVSRSFGQHKRYATESQTKVVTCNFLQPMLLLAVYFTTQSVPQTQGRSLPMGQPGQSEPLPPPPPGT